MKVRIQLRNQVRFYYPDAMVVCQPNPDRDAFQDQPKVIVEVLSRSTRRLDMGEKRDGYLSIASLAVYLLIEQDEPTVIAYRRSDQGFEREVYQGLEAVIGLPEIDCQLPLAEIYDRVEFGAEPIDDDEDGGGTSRVRFAPAYHLKQPGIGARPRTRIGTQVHGRLNAINGQVMGRRRPQRGVAGNHQQPIWVDRAVFVALSNASSSPRSRPRS
jgi:hypothetical protein